MTNSFLSAPQKEKTTLSRILTMTIRLHFLLPRPSQNQHLPSYKPSSSSPLTCQSSTRPCLCLVSWLPPPPRLPLPLKPLLRLRRLVRPLRCQFILLLCRSSRLSSLTPPSPTRRSSRLSTTACLPIISIWHTSPRRLAPPPPPPSQLRRLQLPPPLTSR